MSSVNGGDSRSRSSESESMPRETVRLPKAQQEKVESLVDDGVYSNKSEVLRDGLRHLLAALGSEGDAQ